MLLSLLTQTPSSSSFEIKWRDHPDWVVLATTKSKELWTLAYCTLQYIDTTPAQPATAPTSSTELEILLDNTLSRWKQKKHAVSPKETVTSLTAFRRQKKRKRFLISWHIGQHN